ncbi:MAG: transcription antitermination factor NusB [Pelagibacteraceae bacterium]|jgi:N utilization substance protein B
MKQLRKQAREAVLQALYAKSLSEEDSKKVLIDINLRYEFDEPTKEFVHDLFYATIENEQSISSQIELHLKNWSIERINLIDKIILQMSLAEMIHLKQYDISHKITISTAIENAKKFSSDESIAFVNGILDSIFKKQ